MREPCLFWVPTTTPVPYSSIRSGLKLVKVAPRRSNRSQSRSAYTGGGLILTAAELRELADSLDHDTPETVKSALLDTAAGYQGLLCEDCFQELASECTICPQLKLEAVRDEAGS